MKHTLLMFDVDLTLVDADGAGRQAMLAAAVRVCGEQFTFDDISFGGRLDPLIFADAAESNGIANDEALHDRFRDAYTQELKSLIADNGHRVKPLPGVTDLIRLLHERATQQGDIMLGLLTGNYPQTAAIKIEAAGIKRDWFTLGCFGDEANSRPGLAELAIKRYHHMTQTKADPKRVVIIGDTPHDVTCAKAHGCIAFAVATGRSTRQELQDAGADIVVDDLVDHTPLLRLIA